MSTCKYCGKDAGMLRSAHQECVTAFEKGKVEIADLLLASARGKVDASNAERDVRAIVHSSYIDRKTFQQVVLECLDRAIERALDDGLLTQEEERAVADYVTRYSLDKSQLSTNQSYLRLVKAAVLRDLLQGIIPQRLEFSIALPVNLQKSERIIWLFQHAEYLQPRTHTTYYGRSAGVSLRVMKGVYYRVGQFQGNPVRTTEIATVDKGLLVITNKNLYFVGATKSLRIPYKKIISFQPYSDAVAISRDGVAKPDIFSTDDTWFTYNLISNLASGIV